MPAKPQEQKTAHCPPAERQRFESIIEAMLQVKPKPKKRKRRVGRKKLENNEPEE